MFNNPSSEVSPINSKTNFFHFEADFVDSLRCIPMQVRLKLDTCGIKLKLSQWNRLSPQARNALVDLPCEIQEQIIAYRQLLQQLVKDYNQEIATEIAIMSNPPWEDDETVTLSVQDQAQRLGVEITRQAWARLSIYERFALIKLSRSHHENHNFVVALKEFHLI
jgi:hypothetical protein